MALDSQISIYSIDTGDFYSNREKRLHDKITTLRIEINGVSDKKTGNKKYEGLNDKLQRLYSLEDKSEDIFDEISRLSRLKKHKNKLISDYKKELLELLSNKVEKNIASNGKDHIRAVRERDINASDVISIFESSLTRYMGLTKDDFTENLIVVKVYYFDIIKDLIYHGFTYKGEKYIYFTSSAGQIRTKKTVFIKESVWRELEKTVMCGLTLDKINNTCVGKYIDENGEEVLLYGNNANKHLAYLALANSATDLYEEFDIDKTIVIPDFETKVYGECDYINDKDYSIKRINDYFSITHTDGAGMVLPRVSRKNFMIRLPWVKGLLGSFDYVEFINQHNCSPVIRDIYGVEHNVIEEDIEIIFTESQFKMYKYYNSWDEYKYYYKKYKCTAGICNMEEDRIKNSNINYQMLQTLTDVTDEELNIIASRSVDKLNNLCSSIDSIKNAFGVTPYNYNMTYLQECIKIYPNLLNDEYLKTVLRSIKDSMVKSYKSGRLDIIGKHLFILPDLYAACEHWFLGIENPNGLLDDQEVFCKIYSKYDKLDCLRSPHLYKEHAVRKNVVTEDKMKWFNTNALYTSSKDLISRILQFDCDGDKSLVVADSVFVAIAERNMKDIVPLYYDMRKAAPTILNNESIYDGLNHAFTGGNIGLYSNDISKIWNSDTFIYGSYEDKINAINIVKLLCMENNYTIDYAKTLYKPTRPSNIKDIISKYTNKKLPKFFIYAKDKKGCQVEKINNSLVNRLETIIPNPRINCRKCGLGAIDYKLMMLDSDIIIDKNVINKYIELNRAYHFKINMKDEYANNITYIANEIRNELSQFGYDEYEVSDMLVKYLYGIKNSKSKESLWFCYGKYILHNLQSKVPIKRTKLVKCIDCGEWFEVLAKNNRAIRCQECQSLHK